VENFHLTESSVPTVIRTTVKRELLSNVQKPCNCNLLSVGRANPALDTAALFHHKIVTAYQGCFCFQFYCTRRFSDSEPEARSVCRTLAACARILRSIRCASRGDKTYGGYQQDSVIEPMIVLMCWNRCCAARAAFKGGVYGFNPPPEMLRIKFFGNVKKALLAKCER